MLDVQFLQGVRGILCLTGLTKSVALDGMGQDNGRAATVVVDGLMVSRIDLIGVMPTAVELVDLLIREIFNQLRGFGVLAKEVFAGISRSVAFIILKLA